MADEDRSETYGITLTQLLQQKPYKFDFFQALRRLECLHRSKPRIGRSRRPIEDPIRLAQEISLAFAPSTLASFKPGKSGFPRLAVYFFGLFGPHGPLPLHLSEYARDRLRNSNDPTFSRFADIFHHRMLSLFYRAWANGQPTVNYDRPESDRFSLYVGSLFGMGMPSLRNRDRMPDLAKLFYSGLLASQTRNVDGLLAILGGFFKFPVSIRQFIGQWLEIPTISLWKLGINPENGALGMTTTIGSRVWELQYKFRIIIGPMSFNEYKRFVRMDKSLKRLVAIVRNYIGGELDWDVQLLLKKDEVPSFQLGKTGELGWTTWLKSDKMTDDVNHLILSPLG